MSRPGPILLAADVKAALALTTLPNDIDALAPRLVAHVAAGDLLDGFLLAAGIQQITEDHLHRDPFFLHRAACRLRRRLPGPWGRIAAAMADQTGGLVWRALSRTVGHYATTAWLADLRGLGQSLADRLMARARNDAAGLPATSPTGALALRALNLHGYRPVLATSRSLDEVRDRCTAYGLAGGVTEYGTFVYLSPNGEVHSLPWTGRRAARCSCCAPC
jgi:hypothetical protein